MQRSVYFAGVTEGKACYLSDFSHTKASQSSHATLANISFLIIEAAFLTVSPVRIAQTHRADALCHRCNELWSLWLLTYFSCLGELNLDCLNCTPVRTHTFQLSGCYLWIYRVNIQYLVCEIPAHSSRWYDVWRNVHPNYQTEVKNKTKNRFSIQFGIKDSSVF